MRVGGVRSKGGREIGRIYSHYYYYYYYYYYYHYKNNFVNG